MAQEVYSRIIEHVFKAHYQTGISSFTFQRTEISTAATDLGLPVPSNVGDVIYTFRSRRTLPDEIILTAPENSEWVIRSVGSGEYEFALVPQGMFTPNRALAEVLIPDSTPALVDLYRQSDEQALLAIIRYNRLIDIFTRLSCFSIQSHLRTTLDEVGQVEIDELYIGIDRRGVHYVLPVEVKAANDRLGLGQIENMFTLCEQKFETPIARPLGAQFIEDDRIAMFEFVRDSRTAEIRLAAERHYRLVPSDELPPEIVKTYEHTAE